MSDTNTSDKAFDRIVVVGHRAFGGDAPLWWIGYMHCKPECIGKPLAKAAVNSELEEFFDGTDCIETHDSENVLLAMATALKIAKSNSLPLFRMTDAGPLWDLRVYEELFHPEIDIG